MRLSRGALALVAAAGLALILAGLAFAAPPLEPHPYRLWWSFPRDDLTAIEIDDPDLHVSDFESKWEFANAMQKCDIARAKKLMRKRARGDQTPLREVRIETLDSAGEVHATTRCVLPLEVWRNKLGKRLTERLEDELDAHLSFLVPRRYPIPDGGITP